MNIIKMTGSEKQIAWATDIILAPYRSLEHQANFAEQYLYEGLAPLIRKAMDAYESAYLAVADKHFTTARAVIDRRYQFADVAQGCFRRVAEDAGVWDEPTVRNIYISFRC